MHHISSKNIIVSWILLVVFTCISVALNQFIKNQTLFIICALLIVFLKGQQITDIFMELRPAPKKWRMLLMSYVIIIPLILACIYII